MPYYIGMTNLIDTRQTMLCGRPVLKEKLSVTLGARFPIIIILILILYLYLFSTTSIFCTISPILYSYFIYFRFTETVSRYVLQFSKL